MIVPVCPGEAVWTISNAPVCAARSGTGGYINVNWEYVELSELQSSNEIDLAAARDPFMAGFLLVASCWALGHGVALIIGMVRR